jgi:hypothetical protein
MGMFDDDDLDNTENVDAFERLAKQMQLSDDLRVAIGHFLAEFAIFESTSLTLALQSLSTDDLVIEHLTELMALEQRLKLLKYIGVAKGIPKALMTDISTVSKAAFALKDWRNEIAHGASVFAMNRLNESSTHIGVIRPRSKRVPKGAIPDPDEVRQKWMLSAEFIRELIPITTSLQRSTMQLALKVRSYSRGEPWQSLVVSEISVPKR